MLKTITICAFLLPVVLGQSISRSVPKLTLRPSEAITMSIAFSGNTAIAAVQFDVVVPPQMSLSLPLISMSAAAAGKNVSCAPAIPTFAYRCLMYGLNTNVIPNGTILTVAITVAQGTLPGQLTLKINNGVGARGDGSSAPMTMPSDLTFTVMSLDINADGAVDQADVAIALDEARRTAPPAFLADVNRDSRVDVRDVQLIAAAAGGA